MTNQKPVAFQTIKSIEQIPKLDPDYIVIASPTAYHFPQLKFIEKKLKNKKILVEKPLFDRSFNLKIKNNKVYVGYNLRFHPIIIEIKKAINSKKLWNIQLYCGSYLPEWRPDRDYRLSYSANNDLGGGVLLDLSHEIDYLNWLVGDIKIRNIVNTKLSSLDITSDDFLLFSAESDRCPYIHTSLNYFSRIPLRQIIIDGENINIKADLISNSCVIHENNKLKKSKLFLKNRNTTYLLQHQAILKNDYSKVCSYEEGLII